MADQKEHRLSHYVARYLERAIVEPAWYTAVDTGTVMVNSKPEARMRWEQRRRALGIKPAHLDWYVVQPGLYGQFELKIGRNKPSDNQETTMRLMRERGFATGCAWSVLEFHELLAGAGYKLHGNAENIAAEEQQRWLAAQDGAAVKKPSRPRKPRAPKPSLADITRGNRLAQVRP